MMLNYRLEIQNDDIFQIVVLTGILFAFLASFIVYFVVLYRNRQLKNQREQEQLQASFRQELLKTQIEVQDQTLDHISTEIHDNITQVLSFVKLSLANVASTADGEKKSKINEARELVAQTITDLRDLSKSLSLEQINSLGLVKTIEKEAERVNKSGLLEVIIIKNGQAYSLGQQRELVLFRIFQETLNNTLKHANAKHLKIILQYHPDLFNLTLEDDGSGFSVKMIDNKLGSGLKNIENRASLIGGTANIVSAPHKGCCTKISLDPLKTQFYTDGGTHPDRIS
ncbi:sensor histidine kinase [Mucilaginibacter sp. McL0603]|uniref:sensor histidine kinase n=1 Tax=Mucilaginibacter sp. McL0603 TaxID=3415670 RepID=UPI003CF02444